ncbi:MAG: glycerate kinase, partial [Mariprofundaceae bacterium]
DSRLAECSFTILADVMSPLCGKSGATAVYGPQKGVKASEVGRIDDAVSDFAGMCAGAFDFDPSSREGAGAAGGLGFAFMLLGGEVVSGADYVINTTGLHDKLAGADWIVTGEGCSDMQTLQGKLPYRVALTARDAGVNVALLSGSVEKDALADLEKEFDLIISARPEAMSSEEAISRAETLLAKSAADLARKMNCEH